MQGREHKSKKENVLTVENNGGKYNKTFLDAMSAMGINDEFQMEKFWKLQETRVACIEEADRGEKTPMILRYPFQFYIDINDKTASGHVWKDEEDVKDFLFKLIGEKVEVVPDKDENGNVVVWDTTITVKDELALWTLFLWLYPSMRSIEIDKSTNGGGEVIEDEIMLIPIDKDGWHIIELYINQKEGV